MDPIAYCPRCGRQAIPDAAFCAGCGTQLAAPVDVVAAPPVLEPVEEIPSAKRRRRWSTQEADEAPRCLKCGSAQVHAEKRGWSLGTGFIGSGRIVLTCLACGAKQKPGDRPPSRHNGGRFKS